MPAYPTVAVEGVPVPVAVHSVVAQPVDTCTPSEKPSSVPHDTAAASLKKLDKMWSRGLCTTIAKSVAAHPLRIAILDNST